MLVAGANVHGHHRAQALGGQLLAALHQQRAQAAGDGREYDVVDRAAQAFA